MNYQRELFWFEKKTFGLLFITTNINKNLIITTIKLN